jgi:hypothetical protein
VCSELDPVLVAAGFLAGQGGGDDDGSGQVIWCIGHDVLSSRYPLLPQANPDGAAGRCDDLVIDVGVGGTLDRLDFEGSSLAQTLRQVGLDADADAVSQLSGRPVADGSRVLGAALRRLFSAAG